ncbi:MAG: hypothetical protein ABI759_25715 [Candidatus Solibacter sp.]
MTRRGWLGISIAFGCWAADPSQQVLDLVADAAGSLSAGDAAGFLKAFDRAMPGYERLRQNVMGLVALGEVRSAIEAQEDEGNDQRRQVQFLWTLQILAGPSARVTTRREQAVSCTVEKQAGKWRITKLEPVDFFAPIPPR